MKILALPGLCALLASSASAQSFSYPDFTSLTGLVENYAIAGTAGTPIGVVGTAYRLTSSSPLSQHASLWYGAPVSVAGGFDTTFTYTISSQVSGGADGLAFVIHNDPRGSTFLGRHASAIGYAQFATDSGWAVTNALVVEIDTFQTTGGVVNDPNGTHIGVMSGGTGNCLQNHTTHGLATYTNTLIGGSSTRSVRIEYVPGTLKVYWDDLVTPKLTLPYDFVTGGTLAAGGAVGGLSLAGGTNAWVGFTASTGGSTENHDLASWSWSSAVTGPSVYCTAGTSTNGCVPAIGATGVPSVAATSGFTISVANVEGQKQGLLFYGVTGRNNLTWGIGGTSFLCVKSPTQRMGNQQSGGTVNACDGALSVDWLAFVAANPTAVGSPFAAGTVVNAQGWYRDPPNVKTTSMSDGLEFTLVP